MARPKVAVDAPLYAAVNTWSRRPAQRQTLQHYRAALSTGMREFICIFRTLTTMAKRSKALDSGSCEPGSIPAHVAVRTPGKLYYSIYGCFIASPVNRKCPQISPLSSAKKVRPDIHYERCRRFLFINYSYMFVMCEVV